MAPKKIDLLGLLDHKLRGKRCRYVENRRYGSYVNVKGERMCWLLWLRLRISGKMKMLIAKDDQLML